MTTFNERLSPSQRSAWASYAASTPVPHPVKGNIFIPVPAMFVKCGLARFTAGLPLLLDPPSGNTLAVYTPPDITLDQDGTITVDADETDDWAQSGGAMIVNVTQPTNATAAPIIHLVTTALVILGGTPTVPALPASVPNPFPVVPGQAQLFKVNVNDPDGRPGIEDRQQVEVPTVPTFACPTPSTCSFSGASVATITYTAAGGFPFCECNQEFGTAVVRALPFAIFNSTLNWHRWQLTIPLSPGCSGFGLRIYRLTRWCSGPNWDFQVGLSNSADPTAVIPSEQLAMSKTIAACQSFASQGGWAVTSSCNHIASTLGVSIA